MKILISADMEGISGVVSPDHTSSEHEEYGRFRRLMTAEVNAAVEGAIAGGATKVVVNDSHGPMTNILIEELNPAADLISGAPKPFAMMQGISPDIDAVFFVGYHASSGSGAAVLAHTWSSSVHSVQLNGQCIGETGLNAALAGAYDVPVVLVTGDRAVVMEARALLGELETVVVKEGVSQSSAQCVHPEVARNLVRQAAERAMKCEVQPFVVTPPIMMSIAFHQVSQADRAEPMPGTQRVDGLTLEWIGDDMREVYRAFRTLVQLAG